MPKWRLFGAETRGLGRPRQPQVPRSSACRARVQRYSDFTLPHVDVRLGTTPGQLTVERVMGTAPPCQVTTLLPGEVLTVAGRSVRFNKLWLREEPQRQVIGATLDVLGTDGAVIGTLEPRMNYYNVNPEQPVPTPDVRSGIRGDLYATLMAFDSLGRHATLKVIVEPLVPWIWFGGLVVVIGAVIASTQKLRTAARTVEAVA